MERVRYGERLGEKHRLSSWATVLNSPALYILLVWGTVTLAVFSA